MFVGFVYGSWIVLLVFGSCVFNDLVWFGLLTCVCGFEICYWCLLCCCGFDVD